MTDEGVETCGYGWGWHDEHWCEEPDGHDTQHFCPCGAERDLDQSRDEEEPSDG